MRLEDLRPGASVISSDGHKLGKLHRFVIHRDTLRLTHIVVDTGFLRSSEPLWKGGWGLSHDRVVPVGVLGAATPDEVRLTMSAEEFRDMSVDYIEERFAPIPDIEPDELDASDVARLAASMPGGTGPHALVETMAIAPDEVDIKKDSPVWRLNPHEKIGEVEGLIFDEDTGNVAALVVRRGFFFTKDVVLPADHIVEVVADIVRIQLSDDELRALAEHRPKD